MRWLLRGGLLVLGAALVGCNTQPQAGQGQAAPKPPEVFVSPPVQRSVRDYEDFTGRVEAVKTVEVRPHVTGYLDRVLFKEGVEVESGQLLAEIDPKPFEAELARAQASLVLGQAHLDRLSADFARAQRLRPGGIISQEDYDKIAGDRKEAEATVGVAQAALKLAQVNLAYTKIVAPIRGRIGRRFYEVGNLVKADDMVLTTIVSLDPIYATFDVDERTVLRRLIREGKIATDKAEGIEVQMGLGDDDAFPYTGKINFVDNQVDPGTGTLRLRATFDNPKHLLTPGLFARVRMPMGEWHPALLVPEAALGRDQGQKVVYVVDDQDQVVSRRVQVGRVHEGLREITTGLSAGDRVIVSGLQRVRAGVKVTPKEPGSGFRGQESGVRGQESGVRNPGPDKPSADKGATP